MPSKIEVSALVVFIVAGFWWWTAWDTPGERPEAEETSAARPAMRAPQDGAQTPHSLESLSPTSRIENANVSEPGVLAPEVARTNAAGEEIAAPLEGQESSRTRRGERRGSSERERERSAGGENEKKPGHGETGQDRPLLGLPLTLPGEAPQGTDPIDPDAAGATEDELIHMDVDGDDEISQWELDRTAPRESRAKHHPEKNDLGDGAYPIERENYRKPSSRFDAIDTNQDGLMDHDEYYEFLFNADRVLQAHDANVDNMLSLDESGLSQDEFEALDRDGSETLGAWELRDAVAKGDID